MTLNKSVILIFHAYSYMMNMEGVQADIFLIDPKVSARAKCHSSD